MSELLSKISSYNLYNYLLVGFVYNMLLCHYTQLGYVDESILKTLIVCYVMGLFIAKLASLFLEPLLIRLHWNNKKFLKWRNKNEYLEASLKMQKYLFFWRKLMFVEILLWPYSCFSYVSYMINTFQYIYIYDSCRMFVLCHSFFHLYFFL